MAVSFGPKAGVHAGTRTICAIFLVPFLFLLRLILGISEELNFLTGMRLHGFEDVLVLGFCAKLKLFEMTTVPRLWSSCDFEFFRSDMCSSGESCCHCDTNF